MVTRRGFFGTLLAVLAVAFAPKPRATVDPSIDPPVKLLWPPIPSNATKPGVVYITSGGEMSQFGPETVEQIGWPRGDQWPADVRERRIAAHRSTLLQSSEIDGAINQVIADAKEAFRDR